MNKARVKELHATRNWSISGLAELYGVSNRQIEKIVRPGVVSARTKRNRDNLKRTRQAMAREKSLDIVARVMELKKSTRFAMMSRNAKIRELRRCGMTTKEIGDEYGLTQGHVSVLCRNLDR